MPPTEVLQLLKQASRPGQSVPDDADLDLLTQLLESGKRALHAEAEAFWQQVGDQAVLVAYSNDGTELKAGHTVPYGSSSGHAKWRKGKQVVEVLIQQTFLRFIDLLARSTPVPSSRSHCP